VREREAKAADLEANAAEGRANVADPEANAVTWGRTLPSARRMRGLAGRIVRPELAKGRLLGSRDDLGSPFVELSVVLLDRAFIDN
jgi:hypothetical protein